MPYVEHDAVGRERLRAQIEELQLGQVASIYRAMESAAGSR